MDNSAKTVLAGNSTLGNMVGVKNLHVKDSRGDKEIIPYERKKGFGDLLLDWICWFVLGAFALGFVVYMKYWY